jgi:hypothetical protein
MKVRKTIGIWPDCPDGTDGTNPSVLAVLANSHCFLSQGRPCEGNIIASIRPITADNGVSG